MQFIVPKEDIQLRNCRDHDCEGGRTLRRCRRIFLGCFINLWMWHAKQNLQTEREIRASSHSLGYCRKTLGRGKRTRHPRRCTIKHETTTTGKLYGSHEDYF
ncbi:hypothetical protein Y1Q_0002012 [Alligator mississippiensis]|uniref:Uncharacterized protein n=1 Tax=Alligator mississippiensis TaxID=8496 RepID=A0A151MNU3_ALLMI|nr:hypothetical protein Y1Q_0002012 [Alligator mississippiensis]